MIDFLDAALSVILAAVLAFFLGGMVGEAKAAKRCAVQTCGECVETVRECGDFVCVPGRGWQEMER